MKDRTLGPHEVTLVAGFLLMGAVFTGCRGESERTAMAQVPDRPRSETSGVVPQDSAVTGVQVRRLWAGSYRDFYASSISPDGRYLSMIDWSTTDLAVRDLRTGELHRLTNVVREEGEPYEDAGVSVFSRDGRRIVVGWQYYPHLQLRLVDFETNGDGVPRPAEPTLMYHNPLHEPYYPFDWSPDGSQVLAKVYTSGSANQLALISVDGTYRALKSFDWREPTMAEFSPDGRYVAYDFLPESDGPNRDIFIVSLDGAREARVVEGPAIDRLLGWLPDGSVLFHSDRGGSPGVWRVPVSAGRAVGPPELVRPDMWGVEPLGFAGNDFYYGVDANPERLYTAAVDLEAGRLTSTPVQVADPAAIRVRGWDWSPDGEFLVYSGSVPGARGSRIGIVGGDGEERRSFHLDLASSSRLRWHPDGGSLVAYTRDSKDRRGFYRIDLESGSYRAILYTELVEESTPRGNFALSPDGKTLYYARGTFRMQGAGRLNLVALDLESGETRHVAEIAARGRGAVALAPDGSRLAAILPGATEGESVLGTIPVGGGPAVELVEIPDGVLVQRLTWTRDGRSIVYRAVRPQDWPQDGSACVCVLDVDGNGEPRSLDLGEGVRAVLRIHPDGRRIAFMAGESRGEVWVMEGLGEPASTHTETEDSR